MGWITKAAIGMGRFTRIAIPTIILSAVAAASHAQAVGTGANLYQSISNSSLTLYVGSGSAVGGVFQLETSAANDSDPAGVLLYGPVALTGNAIEAQNGTPILVGTRLFVRVDGGKSAAGGYDYVFGRNAAGAASDGKWLIAPRLVGNHIEGSWQTLPITVNGTTIDPRIEIDLVASLVHDQVRFQFKIKNNSPGTTHRVGLAFTEDVDTTFVTSATTNFTFGGPVRLPNAPYLHKESLLAGGQVPPYWDVFVLGPPASGSTASRIRSIRGYLAPLSSSQSEPTRPSRFAYGDLYKLNGVNPNPPATVVGRDYDFIWNFKPDPSVLLEDKNASDAAVTCFWDEQAVGAGQAISVVTYIGESSSDTDFTPPVSLSVSGPLALGYETTKDTNGVPTGSHSTPNPFTISAYVQNETDILNAGTGSSTGITISPVTLFLDLPKGLKLAAGETNPKSVLNLSPGSEGTVSWQVMTDDANPANGKLTYTVTSSPNLGNGKAVQRSIQVPAPAILKFPGTATTQGLYDMVSVPLITGNTTPSTVLNLTANQPAPDFDLVRFNPTLGHYEPVNSFLPGYSYWLRSRLTSDRAISIDTTKYPPLDAQVQPSATPYKISYPRGWNQIATPNIYNVRFSELQVFDQSTLQLLDISTAADQIHQWIQPSVYTYDTSDANPQNWHYVLQDNLGFDMAPYKGYWILVKRDNLQFYFPGVDTPGASVTRAALVGVGLASPRSRALSNNWTVTINAKGAVSTDTTTTIGVNPNATDVNDYYKTTKPPMLDGQLSLDIVHNDWKDGARYARDLRSASTSRKTWDMVVSSSRANETVTLSWPEFATSVPKNYRLTLVDVDTNTRYDMRSTSSAIVTTNAAKNRSLQVIAEPTRGRAPALITSFDLVQNPGRASGSPSSVSVNYTLSQSADTRIVIRSADGRVLRTLNGTPVGGASNTGRAVFDMRDSQGRLISTGVYQAELIAQGTDGSISRQIRPMILSR